MMSMHNGMETIKLVNYSTCPFRPEAHAVSCAIGTQYLPQVKPLRSGVEHPPTYSAELKEIVDPCLHPFSVPFWRVL
jgi:hypothetical protein